MNIFETGARVQHGKYIFHLTKVNSYKFQQESAFIAGPGLIGVNVYDLNENFLGGTGFFLRFETEQDASNFCEDIVSGKYPVSKLKDDHLSAWERIRENLIETATFESKFFFSLVQVLDLDLQQLTKILNAYDNLSDMAKKFVRTPITQNIFWNETCLEVEESLKKQ